MSTHSQPVPPAATRHARPRPHAASRVGFLGVWDRLIGPAPLTAMPSRRGRKARIPLTTLLPALIFHVMQDMGTLSEHLFELTQQRLADSSWSDRRARLPWEVFAEMMRRVLQPRALAEQHPDAFWRGWRLVALDGTQFSLTNTPQVATTRRKARSRRGAAAFAKLGTAVLLELGLHNPLAAAIARDQESEWELASRLLAQLPTQALLLGDRLYGCGAFATLAWHACQRVGSHFLLRARSAVKPGVVERLKDGSRLVVVPIYAGAGSSRIVDWLHLREIRVRVARRGHRGTQVRLWTSLLDPEAAPAGELGELYARRWEHELYYREVKRQLRKTDVLQSHTPETGAQEIAALVLASAVLADERARAATGEVPVLRVSFGRVLRVATAIWVAIDLGAGILSDAQIAEIVDRGYARMRQYVTPPRRSRSCPRAVRRPVTGWPRLMKNESIEAPLEFTVV
jgi:Transposase DDE domain